jgi:hypothetical protein
MPSDENAPDVTPTTEDGTYRDALWGAYEELQKVKAQKRELTIRETRLTRSINALFPLVFGENSDVNALSLPNAIRLIMDGADRPLAANDLKTKLEDLGFDFNKYENPIANILTAMKRMVENEELVYISGDNKRVAAGPSLKPPPELPAGNWEAAMAGMIEGGVLPEGGFYTPPATENKESEK